MTETENVDPSDKPGLNAYPASQDQVEQFLSRGALGDVIFGNELDPDEDTAFSKRVGSTIPYARTLLRIHMGLDPPERLAEVSNGDLVYEPGHGIHVIRGPLAVLFKEIQAGENQQTPGPENEG